MIIDSSALVAIVLEEPGFERYYEAVSLGAPDVAISAASWLETAMVVDRRGDLVAVRRLGDLVVRLGIHVVPFTSEHAAEGRTAWRRFGRGSGHGAALNFGDCIACGTAKSAGRTLPFKGGDFSRTDIASALAP